MKKLVATVLNMTPAARKRCVWRGGKAYRYKRYAGAARLVPCVDKDGKQWRDGVDKKELKRLIVERGGLDAAWAKKHLVVM